MRYGDRAEVGLQWWTGWDGHTKRPPGGEVTRRRSKTGQECEAAESGAGSLGGAGETDSSLRTSLFTGPSPRVCLCLARLHSRRS